MPYYELFCGVTSSLLVAPIMTIIDTAVIKTQIHSLNLKQAFSESIQDYATRKIKIGKPFGIMFLVYGSTYSTANLTEYTCKVMNVDSKLPTLFLTSAVNIASISYKDKEYTKLFNQQKRNFPKASYGLFALRDCMTIASSFTFKKDAMDILQHYVPHNFADLVASLVLPMSIQLLSTPLHILAIDLYQRPKETIKNRFHHIQSMYSSVCGGRILRVIPAFCLGGFVNDMLRNRSFE